MSLVEPYPLITEEHARRCSELFNDGGKAIGSNGQYYGKCPVHGDKKPSMSISIGTIGDRTEVLFNCHAQQCEYKHIRKYAEDAGILPPLPKTSKSGHFFKDFDFVEAYPYIDENGKLEFEKLRLKHWITGEKHFLVRTKTPEGKTQFKIGNARRLPYNLPEVIKAAAAGGEVILHEGERDCNNCAKFGFVTSTCYSSSKWDEAYTVYFRGCKRVVMVVDNDFTGYSFLNKVGESFFRHKIPFFWMVMPGAKKKGDFTDWLNEGNDGELFGFLIETETKEWTKAVQNPWPNPKDQKEGADWNTESEIGDTGKVVEMRPQFKISIDKIQKLTDVGNAKRILALHGDKIRYCAARGFYIWGGKSFEFDEKGFVFELAKDTMRTTLDNEYGTIQTQELIKIVMNGLKMKGIRSMIDALKTEPEIAVSIYDFDRDPLILNCQNGVLHLGTGAFEKHSEDSKKYLCTQITAAGFDQEIYEAFETSGLEEHEGFRDIYRALVPNWASVMDYICGEDDEMWIYLQDLGGYALTGLTNQQAAFMIHGDGSNLKSTWIDTLTNAIGSYGTTVRSDMFMKRAGFESHQDNFSQLLNIRIAAVQEVDASDRLDESKLKVFTGGTDKISARFMRGEPFKYDNKAKAIFRINHLPRIANQDKGIWRRIKKIPFHRTMEDGNAIRDFDDRLRREWPGIIAFFAIGAKRFLKRGRLQEPAIVTKETEEYKMDMDTFGFFLDTATEKIEKYAEAAKNLMGAYKIVAEEFGFEPVGHVRFSALMKSKGFTREHTKTGSVYVGLKVREEYLPKVKPRYSRKNDE